MNPLHTLCFYLFIIFGGGGRKEETFFFFLSIDLGTKEIEVRLGIRLGLIW